MQTRVLRPLILYVCILVTLCRSYGQSASSDYVYATGSPNFSVNIPVQNGFINVANGNLHLEFPLAGSKQRGNLTLDEKLVYDSRIWMIGHYSNYYWWPTNVPNSSDGWRFVSGAETGTTSPEYLGYNSDYCDPYWYVDGGFDTNQCYQGWMSYSWTDPSNTVHQFDVQWVYQNGDPYYGWSGGSPQTVTGYAADASGYTIQLSGNNDSPPTSIQIFDTSGTQVYPQVIDRFGNYFSKDGNGNLIDTLGRTPVLVTQSGNVTYYDVLKAGGTRARYTVTMGSISIGTSFGQPAVNEWSGTLNTIQSIGLPDGSSYSFNYDNYGAVTSVTLPTGGTAYYSWMTYFDSYHNANRWVTSASGKESATLAPSVVTYCSGPTQTGCQEQVVVSRASGDTKYLLTLTNGAWDTTTTVYNGPISNNTPIMSEALTYDFSQTCQQYCGTGPAYITQSTKTTTLSDVGLQSKVQTTNVTHLNIPQSIKMWDFGANFSGGPTQETDFTYTNTGNPYSIGPNYLIASETTLDSSGQTVAKTTYNYTTSATATSGIVSHGSTNSGGPYLQNISQWLNASGSGSLTSSITSEDTGTVLSMQDPGGFTTSFGHDATDTFATSTTPPIPASGVSLGSSATYDFSTGLLTSTTDPNSAQTIYSNYDAFGRVGEIDYPDGGKTTFSYTPTQSSVHQYQNASTYSDTETIYNTYGVPIRTEVANGQGTNPWYQQDICYNSEGEVAYRSNRYQGNGSGVGTQCSGNGDTLTYDALGRVTQVLHSDGTSINTMHTGRATKTTDEYGVSKITQADAFGRTTAVCEVTGSTLPSSSAPANCGLDVAGTGYLTTYSYDLYNHQTSVNQGGQIRVFQTDWAGRQILRQEPESGQTTFSYGYNSTGLQVYRVRPRANQTNPSVLTSDTTQYDALGRVVNVVYSDGTPAKTFNYDLPQEWGVTLNNTKGRMTNAWSAAMAGNVFSYDAMGRIIQILICTPSTCGFGGYGLNYSYDLSGNLLTATDGFGVNTTYTYSTANEVNSITSSRSDSTHPPNLVSSVQNGPYGPLNWKLGNGLCEARQYDAMGRLTGGGVFSGSNPPSCSSGTQQYSFTGGWTGGYLTSSSDSVLGQTTSYSYDPLGRLSARNVTSGNPGGFTYSFDRWGNRVAQTVTSGSGPQPNYSFTNNQIQGANCPTTSQICYDAAGNETSDGINSYVYDAEGNVIQQGTTSYVYDALNHQVRQNYPSVSSEVLFGANGQIASLELAGGAQIMGKAYWGNMPIESYQVGANKAYFQHFDWNLNKRLTSDYSGAVYGKHAELPFGDGFQNVTGSRDNTFDDFGGMWDIGLTMHAQFREYSDMEGSWMQPDPYQGSYDFSNPQSLNRYAYVNGMPLSFVDPRGLDGGVTTFVVTSICGHAPFACFVNPYVAIGIGAAAILGELAHIFGWGRPAFHGSLTPRPNTPTPSNAQIKQDALRQKRLRSCSQTLFGNANALNAANAPMIQYLSPSQMKTYLGGYLGTADAAGAANPATNTVYFNSSVFKGNLPYIYYQSNYLHEAGNIISFNLFRGDSYARGNMFVGPNENPVDTDSGASFERCIFGQRMQIP